jgi:transcriptional regulator with XRE-family HTH domain
VTRATPPDKGKSRRSQPDSAKHSDDGPTILDGPRLRDPQQSGPTNVDGPPISAPADDHDTSAEELVPAEGFEDAEDDPTIYRGDRPQRPSSSRRLSPTLMKVFQRKREQIGMSIAQLAKLTGIEEEELLRFEGTNGQHRLVYDHVVLLARVLGVRPQDMPGLRARETKDATASALSSLATALMAGPMITFEGKAGERYGGDLERLGTTPHVGVRIGDGALAELFPRGALLAFVADVSPAPGDVVLLRHRRTRQLAMRRVSASLFAPLASWQPAYPSPSPDWHPVARLQIVLPRP